MALAMRLCARALRRTQQPAVASTRQRWVSTRWFGKTRNTTAEEQKALARAAEMKEELYNTILDITNKYKVPGKIGRDNRLLLERLSVQVEPRLNDPYCGNPSKKEFVGAMVGLSIRKLDLGRGAPGLVEAALAQVKSDAHQ